MIALDTNVLVRYLVQDDKVQADEATKVIERLTAEEPAFIASIVLCELVWVLQACYKQKKSDCVNILQHITSIGVFTIENADATRKALRVFEEGTADFSDYLIQQIAAQAGYAEVITFDQRALKTKGFRAPK